MARLAGFWKKIADGWTVQRIAAVLIVVGVVVFVVGVINKHCTCASLPNLGDMLNDIIGDFYANVSVDCLSIAFAILVIDRLNERGVEQKLKAQLIGEMGSGDNGIALRAVNELQTRGWLEDGSLRNSSFSGANLENVNLASANLQGILLFRANLRNAQLRVTDLRGAKISEVDLENAAFHWVNLDKTAFWKVNLRKADFSLANLKNTTFREANLENANFSGADMANMFIHDVNFRGAMLKNAKLYGMNQGFFSPCYVEYFITARALRFSEVSVYLSFDDIFRVGSLSSTHIYDGRLNLPDDIREAEKEHISTDNPAAMADFYGVTLDEYLAGQEWAREHLAGLRREAGLDPDTGLPVEPTNGVEPRPAQAPAQPAPRRNGQRHKASMVAHRTRR